MGIFDKRKNYKPFEYDYITEPIIQAIWAGHWVHSEFSFSSDVQDFHTQLTPEEQQVIKKALLLISQIEIAVKSYWGNIGKLLPKPEISDFGSVLSGNEVIHSRAYSEVLERLGLNEDFDRLFDEPIVSRRVEYLTKYVNKVYQNDHQNILYSLILFSIFTENVSLFSQFYIILGFSGHKNVLKDVANVVDYTCKEETLHFEGGAALINVIKSENPELMTEEFIERIYHEVQEAFKAEQGLIEWILQGYENDFLSQGILENYVRIRLNDSLVKIGLEPQFEVEDKWKEKTAWMTEKVYGMGLADFFWKKPTEYAKGTQTWNEDDLF